MFHDLSPGANTAASNTLALIMAAYLIGSSSPSSMTRKWMHRTDRSSLHYSWVRERGVWIHNIGSCRFLKDYIGDRFVCMHKHLLWLGSYLASQTKGRGDHHTIVFATPPRHSYVCKPWHDTGDDCGGSSGEYIWQEGHVCKGGG